MAPNVHPGFLGLPTTIDRSPGLQPGVHAEVVEETVWVQVHHVLSVSLLGPAEGTIQKLNLLQVEG
jgi:hypothetical protein